MTTGTAATRIADADQALAVAADLSAAFAADAGARDADRALPHAQVQALKESGLLALPVPVEHGGIAAPAAVIAEVFRLFAHGDPSLAQIPHSHYTFLEAVRLQGTDAQRAFFYEKVLEGALFANAQSERGPHPIDVDTTTLIPDGDGYVLQGRKFYCTGALFADWVIVRASLPERPGDTPTSSTPKALAFVPADAEGLQVVDDWDGMGQRTTASGTVTLDAVSVPAERVVAFTPIFGAPTVYGARAQLLHTALDVGIATAALAEGVRQAGKARPHFEAGVDAAADDPTVVHLAGELTVTVRGAQALLAEAGRAVDAAAADLDSDSAAAASVAVAVAKVAATRASLEASSALFELGGTGSASGAANLSRYWRDARTHTLHDPTRW
ncbi:MAG: acyl-CoA dehydrogenase family protein, partial [Mycolicibacterium frederiksbergense]|nr:acyl-CoA dehydrogenase family protein [Mycolicibacterium frederiksbergense]